MTANGNIVAARKTKKAAVAEHPEVHGHVGLLFNGPPVAGGVPSI
jgi:hypothetical protein